MQINQGRWCQETWSAGDPRIRGRAKDLRNKGYQVIVSSMGNQVTKYGIMKLTMITIYPGNNPDTMDVGECESQL